MHRAPVHLIQPCASTTSYSSTARRSNFYQSRTGCGRPVRKRSTDKDAHPWQMWRSHPPSRHGPGHELAYQVVRLHLGHVDIWGGVDINEDLVQHPVTGRFPPWSHLQIRPVAMQGNDTHFPARGPPRPAPAQPRELRPRSLWRTGSCPCQGGCSPADALELVRSSLCSSDQ